MNRSPSLPGGSQKNCCYVVLLLFTSALGKDRVDSSGVEVSEHITELEASVGLVRGGTHRGRTGCQLPWMVSCV